MINNNIKIKIRSEVDGCDATWVEGLSLVFALPAWLSVITMHENF